MKSEASSLVFRSGAANAPRSEECLWGRQVCKKRGGERPLGLSPSCSKGEKCVRGGISCLCPCLEKRPSSFSRAGIRLKRGGGGCSDVLQIARELEDAARPKFLREETQGDERGRGG